MMKFRIISLILSLIFLVSGVVIAQVEDKIYLDHIQSVRLFQNSGTLDSQLDAPVVSLYGGKEVMLLFDDLAYDPELYSAKLVHCDADWKPSQLRDNDFLNTFNEFTIQDYDYSINTRLPYIHYRFRIPAVTKSGNYIIKVYQGRDESKLVLTKRFMVYEDLFTVGASLVPPSQNEDRRAGHQLNVIVNYSKGENVIDVKNQVKVVIRQNQRWDNAKTILKPTFMNEISKNLRYESFDGSNYFKAGNEFRFIDLRFIRAAGLNIASVEVKTDVVYADVVLDQPRPESVYSQYLDINGQYLVYTNDRPGGDPELESEYVLTKFRFVAPESISPVYLIGSLTQWGKSTDAKMTWNPKTKQYETTLLLKQGWYDFQYGLLNQTEFDTNSLEGTYFQTENEYEVLVYFRALGSRYDQLAGHIYLQPNRRRF
jgi:hypothetical protein